MCEMPLLCMPRDTVDRAAHLARQHSKLSARDQARLAELHDPDPTGPPAGRLERIFGSNCIEGEHPLGCQDSHGLVCSEMSEAQ